MILHLFDQEPDLFPLSFVSLSARHPQEPVNRVGGFYDVMQLLFVLDGEGILRCEGKEYRLVEGCAFWLDVDVPHAYEGDGELVTAWITFRGSVLENIRRYIGGRRFVFWERLDLKKYVTRLSEIEREYYDTKREGRMSAMTYSLVFSFLEDRERHTQSPMDGVLRYLEEHFDRRVTVSELAELVHLSKSAFCQKFKAAFGCTAFERLMEIRLYNAEMMLRLNRDDKIGHIAKRCGFEDVGYFCKAYRKKYGMTPTEHRTV